MELILGLLKDEPGRLEIRDDIGPHSHGLGTLAGKHQRKMGHRFPPMSPDESTAAMTITPLLTAAIV
jgi:hypothetical protein